MHNWFATAALIAWPCVSILLFLTRPLNQAILWIVLAAQLLLPVGETIKYAMVPQFDKDSIPSLCIFIGCAIIVGRPWRILKQFGIAEALIVAYLTVPIITSELNTDSIVFGEIKLPAVGLYDAISTSEAAFISLIPFFIGRRFLSSAADHSEILRVLVLAGLIYSIPILFEVRFSPQLHYWVYGFFPGEFAQSMRGDGYRPMVFMGHGLIAALFMMMTAVAGSAFWKARVRLFELPTSGITTYLFAVLIACKSLGAATYGAVFVPIVRLTRPRFQMRIAVVLVSITLLYPLMRSLDLFPTHFLVETSRLLSDDRADSLAFRFDNEDQLLKRAFERAAFGWGRFGRSRVYDADTSSSESITDGVWIVTIGEFGIFGFIAQFGLLTLGVFRAAKALELAEYPNEGIFLAALSLIISVNILDLLPNSALMPWTWLLCGSLLGRTEVLSAVRQKRGLPDPSFLHRRRHLT